MFSKNLRTSPQKNSWKKLYTKWVSEYAHLLIWKRVKEVGSLGPEHKPGSNGNIGSAVKQYAETTGHDIHPNYANILETGVKTKTKTKRLFLEPWHSFLNKNSVNERAPFPRVYASLVSILRSNKQWCLFLYICILWLGEYISLKKAAEGSWKFSLNVF